jgi:hypothetical protein
MFGWASSNSLTSPSLSSLPMTTTFAGARRRLGRALACPGPKRDPAATVPAAPAAPWRNLRREIRLSSMESAMLATSFPSPNPHSPSRPSRNDAAAYGR